MSSRNKNETIEKFFNNMYSATRDLFKKLRNGKSIDFFINRLIEMESSERYSSVARIFNHCHLDNQNKYCLSTYKFTYNAMEQKTRYLRKYRSDILCGLYFPNNSIGDEIMISANCKFLHTIHIKTQSDLERIHFPLKADFILPLICLGLSDITVIVRNNFEKPYFSIGMMIGDTSLRSELGKSQLMYKGINLKFQNYNCEYVEPNHNEDYNEDVDQNVVCDYNEIYAVNLIKKFWKRYKLRKNKRESVCGEIKALPVRGIDYKNAMKNFYKNV